MTHNFLALTETWITPEKSATPAALSTSYSSHTPRPQDRARRRDWTPHLPYMVLPGPSTRTPGQICILSPRCHCHPSIKLFIVVIYHPPDPLCDFYDEMDAILTCFPENGTPLIILGDFNVLLKKLHSPELTTFFTTFDLSLSPSPPTHRAGNQQVSHKVKWYFSSLSPPSLYLTLLCCLFSPLEVPPPSLLITL